MLTHFNYLVNYMWPFSTIEVTDLKDFIESMGEKEATPRKSIQVKTTVHGICYYPNEVDYVEAKLESRTPDGKKVIYKTSVGCHLRNISDSISKMFKSIRRTFPTAQIEITKESRMSAKYQIEIYRSAGMYQIIKQIK